MRSLGLSFRGNCSNGGSAPMARASGYVACYDFSDLKIFEQQVAHVLEQEGPVFATLHVEPTKPLEYDYPSLYDDG
jgi:hypothetical protein